MFCQSFVVHHRFLAPKKFRSEHSPLQRNSIHEQGIFLVVALVDIHCYKSILTIKYSRFANWEAGFPKALRYHCSEKWHLWVEQLIWHSVNSDARVCCSELDLEARGSVTHMGFFFSSHLSWMDVNYALPLPHSGRDIGSLDFSGPFGLFAPLWTWDN